MFKNGDVLCVLIIKRGQFLNFIVETFVLFFQSMIFLIFRGFIVLKLSNLISQSLIFQFCIWELYSLRMRFQGSFNSRLFLHRVDTFDDFCQIIDLELQRIILMIELSVFFIEFSNSFLLLTMKLPDSAFNYSQFSLQLDLLWTQLSDYWHFAGRNDDPLNSSRISWRTRWISIGVWYANYLFLRRRSVDSVCKHNSSISISAGNGYLWGVHVWKTLVILSFTT